MKTLLTSFCLLFLFACVPSSQTATTYSRSEAQKTQEIKIGQILDKKAVRIEGTQTGVGTIAGAVVGGIAASTIGDGIGQDLATAVGAIAGGAAGAMTEEKITQANAFEYSIVLSDKKIISVVQAIAKNEEEIKVGDYVKITSIKNTNRISKIENPSIFLD